MRIHFRPRIGPFVLDFRPSPRRGPEPPPVHPLSRLDVALILGGLLLVVVAVVYAAVTG